MNAKFAGWRAYRIFGGRVMFTMMRNSIVRSTIKQPFGGGWDRNAKKFGFWLRIGDTLWMLYQPVKS